METKQDVDVIVEVSETDHRKVEFKKHEVTGREIKKAAGLPPDTELALKRDGELDQIADGETLTVKDGERFVVVHKDILIVVNGREKVWHEHTISFRQVVELAYGSFNGNSIYTVVYSHGPKDNPKGSMVDGDTVHVKSRMVFDATQTNRS
jgi:multiubiquitin